MLGVPGETDIEAVIARRPREMSNLTDADRDQLTGALELGQF